MLQECEKGYHKNGNVKYEKYYQYGKYHRLNGPAYIEYYKNGNKRYERYYQDGKCHRINGPAIIYYNEEEIETEKYFYINGEEYEDELEYMIRVGEIKRDYI